MTVTFHHAMPALAAVVLAAALANGPASAQALMNELQNAERELIDSKKQGKPPNGLATQTKPKGQQSKTQKTQDYAPPSKWVDHQMH